MTDETNGGTAAAARFAPEPGVTIEQSVVPGQQAPPLMGRGWGGACHSIGILKPPPTPVPSPEGEGRMVTWLP